MKISKGFKRVCHLTSAGGIYEAICLRTKSDRIIDSDERGWLQLYPWTKYSVKTLIRFGFGMPHAGQI